MLDRRNQYAYLDLPGHLYKENFSEYDVLIQLEEKCCLCLVEKSPCPHCNGTGVRPTEAGERLLEFVNKYAHTNSK